MLNYLPEHLKWHHSGAEVQKQASLSIWNPRTSISLVRLYFFPLPPSFLIFFFPPESWSRLTLTNDRRMKLSFYTVTPQLIWRGSARNQSAWADQNHHREQKQHLALALLHFHCPQGNRCSSVPPCCYLLFKLGQWGEQMTPAMPHPSTCFPLLCEGTQNFTPQLLTSILLSHSLPSHLLTEKQGSCRCFSSDRSPCTCQWGKVQREKEPGPRASV